MRFSLNDYQADAVSLLLQRLKKARSEWNAPVPKETSVALTAPTGAGKTVMAAATIEALFFGSDEFSFTPDDSAVVIWFSDSPNLNEQSRFRLMQASEKLTPLNLVVVEPPFSMRELESGKVYFLNTQKLGKNSKLVRGYVADGEEVEGFERIAPDDLAFNLWETIGNTIANSEKTVYFVLDEAHRGFNERGDRNRDTIVQQLVSGTTTGQVMPIVVGISATIDRFDDAMKAASARGDRTVLTPVSVEPRRVQESGLLKDIVLLDIPNEPGDFSEILVGEAAKSLDEMTKRWARYSRAQKLPQPVVPLLVLQIPNNQENDEVGRWLDVIERTVPGITGRSVRHVLSDRVTETFGRWDVEAIEPQRVQQSTEVTVLVAKEAISTGWDCPRAEVLVSARPAKDQTHIAQLLGRMVRSPLARRVPGDERLNSVTCILPKFDRTTAGKVVRYITGESELSPLGETRVLVDGRELTPNGEVSEAVWAAFDALPTQTVPRRGVKPVKRLVTLAHALAQDRIVSNALAEVNARTHAELNRLRAEHREAFRKAVEEIEAVRLQRLIGQRGSASIRYIERIVKADNRAVQVGFDEAKRVFGADIAQSYVHHLIRDEDGEDLRDAMVAVSALATMPAVSDAIDHLTSSFADEWFAEHSAAIGELDDERLQVFVEIRALAIEPQLSELRRPSSKFEDFAEVDADDNVSVAPVARKHLLSDEAGDFPLGSLNQWERETVAFESKRSNCSGWYRNPAHNGSDAFSVPYRDRFGEWRALHPDFVVFDDVDGTVTPSIIDPHGTNLEDGRFKLAGLADFAERFGDRFHRIWATVKYNNKWFALDMKREDVRVALDGYEGDVIELYKGPLAFEIYKGDR